MGLVWRLDDTGEPLGGQGEPTCLRGHGDPVPWVSGPALAPSWTWRPGGRDTGGGLTWDVDVHGHDTVTAPHDGVGVVIVATPVGTAAGGRGEGGP